MRHTPRYTWLVAVAIGLAACTTQTVQDTNPSTSSTAAAPTTVAGARTDYPFSGPVEPGTYHIDSSVWNVAGYTMTMPEGWETQYGDGGAFKYVPDGEVGFYFVVVDSIYSDPCVGSSGGAEGVLNIGPSVDDLVNALLEQPHTVTSGPFDTTLGGLPAKRVDLTMEHNDVTASCNEDLPGELQIWYSAPADKYYVLLNNGSDSVYILDVNGQRQVFLVQVQAEAPTENTEELKAIIDSIRIDR